MTKQLIKKWATILIIGFLVLLAIETINMPGQNSVRAICTGLSIDYEDLEYSVSAQIIIPEAGGEYSQKTVIVNNKAHSIEEALHNMEFQIGKKIRLGHCGFIILSKDFCENNITKELDYFLRGNNLGNNTLLLYTDLKAQKVLEKTSNINSNEVDNLQITSKYNQQHLLSKSSSLMSFFNDYLSPHKTSCMPNITLEEEAEKKNSSNSQSGAGEKNNSEPTKDSIKNDGSMAVFVNGKCSKVLSPSECENFQWFDPKLTETRLKIENINNDKIKNGTISFTLSHRCINFEYKVLHNQPIITINYNLGLKPESITSESHIVPTYSSFVDDVVTNLVSNKINQAVSNALSLMQQYEMDLFNFYHQFNLNCHSNWQEYLSNLLPIEHYLDKIKIITNVYCSDEF